MYTFSEHSENQLRTCHPILIDIAKAVIEIYDFRVEFGFRDQVKQDHLFEKGYSKTKWPNSKHNGSGFPPSFAYDCVPYHKEFGLLFGSPEQMTKIAEWFKKNNGVDNGKASLLAYQFLHAQYAIMWGMFKMAAHARGVELRWGGDWDGDNDTSDQRWNDLAHIELRR